MKFAGKPPFLARRSFRASAFTIPELLAAIGIIAVLAAMLTGVYQANISRFEMPKCLANLKTLHTALNAHVQDQKQWPQLPDGTSQNSLAEYQFWIDALKPYGMLEKSWLCPTLTRMMKDKGHADRAPKIHYLPTLFDEHQLTPFKWPNMPWAAEAADAHGKGILRLYSDGSIRPFTAFRDQAQLPAVQPQNPPVQPGH